MKFFTGVTLVDITATGVIRHTQEQETQRNQQRNWETLTQLISLRTQIFDLTEPVLDEDFWSFEFQTESEIFNDGTDPVGVLKADAGSIPMLKGLDNDPEIESVLIVNGPTQNIWFSAEAINTILEN